jgi:hypothetical protein
MEKPLLSLACWITHADIECAQESRTFDQLTIGLNAVSLLLAGVLALVAWSAFFLQFNPVWLALPLALLVAAIVFRLDQAMSASDWELAGVLRQGPLPREWYYKVGARVLVAWLLAYATALGLMLALFSDAITNHLQIERSKANVPIDQEYSALKDDLRRRLVAPLETELAALNSQRSHLQTNVQANLNRQDDALARASAARIEADREKVGGQVAGQRYIPGEGPRWAEAQRQQKEADRLSSIATANVGGLESQIREAHVRIDSKSAELRQANQEFARQISELDKRKLSDPRFIPVRDDPLMRYVAFEEMKSDPKQGAAVSHLSFMAQMLLLTLELAFLLVKLVFAPASVYTVRLITKTKLEAAHVAGDFAGNRDEMRRQRPPLRVVPRANEQAEPVAL